MKHSQAHRISNIIDSTQSSEDKIESIRSLIKQFCPSESNNWNQTGIPYKQTVGQKKIIATSALNDGATVIQKTAKIKKNNKKKKKKKIVSLPSEIEQQKVFTHELCQCCDYQSEEDPQVNNDAAYINSIVQSLGTDLLECFYDEIDKAIARVMKDVDLQHERTFIRLMRKLADIFQDFDLELRQQIQREFEGQTLFAPFNTTWCVPQQFKSYIITRFPLLKDFIQNFTMKALDEKLLEQFNNLKCKSALIESISTHMEEIAIKKSKKKTKRQQQKLNKKSLPSNLAKQNEQTRNIEQSYELQDVLQKLQNMNIKQLQRHQCYFDFERFSKLRNILKDT